MARILSIGLAARVVGVPTELSYLADTCIQPKRAGPQVTRSVS
jgi:hypothetical protein